MTKAAFIEVAETQKGLGVGGKGEQEGPEGDARKHRRKPKGKTETTIQ